MILSRVELTSKGVYEEILTFDKELYQNNSILMDIKSLKGKVEVDYVSNLSLLKISLNGELVLRSTRTLKPVNYKLRVRDNLTITLTKLDYIDEDIIYLKDDELDVNQIFYSLLIASLPLQVTNKDDEYIAGEGYEVISEDEYFRRKSNVSEDSPFAALKDLDLDE